MTSVEGTNTLVGRLTLPIHPLAQSKALRDVKIVGSSKTESTP